MSRLAFVSSVLGAAGVAFMTLPASALPASPANTGIGMASASSGVVEQAGYRGRHGGGVRLWFGSGRRRGHGGGYGGGFGGGYGGGYGGGHGRGSRH